uniref:tax1-binding protein 3 isoform X1 n=1 Tax=Podarcis muralis TaxID=64176 RepID=UPI0010A09F3D|nr:tax1-binding protein 3 isoform X1 [Podarcis muralis]
MAYIPGQPVTAVVQRVEIHKLRQGENLILGFSIGGGIDQDPTQNPFSEDKTDKGIYVTRVTEGGPAEVAGLQVGDKIMQSLRHFLALYLEMSDWTYDLLDAKQMLYHSATTLPLNLGLYGLEKSWRRHVGNTKEGNV